MARVLGRVHVEQALAQQLADDRRPALVVAEALTLGEQDRPVGLRSDQVEQLHVGIDRLLVVAESVEHAADPCVVNHQVREQGQQTDNIQRQGESCHRRAPEPTQLRPEGDRLLAAECQGQAAKELARGQRRHEWQHAQRHEAAVDQPGEQSSQHAADHRPANRQACLACQGTDDHAGQHRDRADRQVDAAGQDDRH